MAPERTDARSRHLVPPLTEWTPISKKGVGLDRQTGPDWTSAESGLSTFRDSEGLWNKFLVYDVATPDGWAANPELVLEFYNQRRKKVAESEPNQAH